MRALRMVIAFPINFKHPYYFTEAFYGWGFINIFLEKNFLNMAICFIWSTVSSLLLKQNSHCINVEVNLQKGGMSRTYRINTFFAFPSNQ